jgi:membrane protease YdiL (CAAX protease family)
MIAWLGIAAAGAALVSVGAETRSICLAPLSEEIVFRWGLQDALSARLVAAPRWIVPLLTAAAFSLAHLCFVRDARDVPRAVATFLPAWWIGWRYEKGGRQLGPCIAWHAAFNLFWLCGADAMAARLLAG